MKTSWDLAIKELLRHEGGNDDDPRDPGGRTSRGILQIEWSHWRETHPGLPSDVWQAPLDQVVAIYRQKYWDAQRCDDLPAGVDYAVFDYGVNSGISRSAKELQKIVGATSDGEIGAETIRRALAADPKQLVTRICDDRLAFLKGLVTWGIYGRGWGTRVDDVRKTAMGMVSAAPPAPTQNWLVALLSALADLFRHSPPTAPSKPGIPPWVAWAQKEVGFHERGANLGIEKYIALAKTGSLGDPWCAIFANAGLEANGIRGTRSAMARSFERDPNFVKLDGPAVGAITTMWRGSLSAGTGHVFYYLGENPNGVLALGGNQSDEVCRQYEPRNRVVGYFWPKSVPLPKTGPVLIKDGGATEGTET